MVSILLFSLLFRPDSSQLLGGLFVSITAGYGVVSVTVLLYLNCRKTDIIYHVADSLNDVVDLFISSFHNICPFNYNFPLNFQFVGPRDEQFGEL